MVYFTAVLFQLDFWGNLLSPIGAVSASVILFITFLRAGRPRIIWLFFSLACFTWAFADILWAFWEIVLGLDPEEAPFFMYAYLLPNLFLMLAPASFLLPQLKKLNLLQLILDFGATVTAVTAVIWIFFFNREFSLLMNLDATGIGTFMYIVTDFLITGLLFLFYISAPAAFRNRTVRLISLSLMLYAVTDLVYCWQVFHDAYIPNSAIDGVYMGSLLLIAVAGLRQKDARLSEISSGTPQIAVNFGSSNRVLLLLLIPPCVVLFRGFVLEEVLFLVGIVAAHQTLSGIVQQSILSEHLLEREKETREQLEVRISERTSELVQANRDLDYLSRTDIVTGLSNRWFFMKEIEKMMNGNQGTPIALFYMDLDRFKAVNDSYGHQTGDSVLVAIAGRLKSLTKNDMLLARLGGDEFVVAVNESDRAKLRQFAWQLVSCCSGSVSVPPYRIQLGVSIGIALYPEDAQDSQTLFKYADIAMYQAKRQNDTRFSFYTSDVRNVVQRRHRIEMLLLKADYEKEFTLHFQPQVDLNTGRLLGMESLLRWTSPELGPVGPAEFIPIAEDTGCIIAISEWVMENAMRRITDWNRRFGTSLKMGINVSPIHICSTQFLPSLTERIGRCGVQPGWIDIEITENSATKNETIMEQALTALTGMGISISIDDFGTGYSSISYIKRFDIQRLKIAKQLIDNVAADESSTQIIRAIVMMAKSMNIRTIAEGVECDEQRDMLRRVGCEQVQGYLTGRPVPGPEFEKTWLQPLLDITENAVNSVQSVKKGDYKV